MAVSAVAYTREAFLGANRHHDARGAPVADTVDAPTAAWKSAAQRVGRIVVGQQFWKSEGTLQKKTPGITPVRGQDREAGMHTPDSLIVNVFTHLSK